MLCARTLRKKIRRPVVPLAYARARDFDPLWCPSQFAQKHGDCIFKELGPFKFGSFSDVGLSIMGDSTTISAFAEREMGILVNS